MIATHFANRIRHALCVGLGAASLTACADQSSRIAPHVWIAPYSTLAGDALWAVAPLHNESGTTLVDTLAVSDAVVHAVEQVRGIHALPLNRTIEAMRAMGVSQLSSAAEARVLATRMGVDGLIVGSVTAWDPYDPPVIGLSLALYASSEPGDHASIDPRKLSAAGAGQDAYSGRAYTPVPLAVASAISDGANHQVLMDLESYAAGRSEPPLGLKRHLASMDLYTEFVAWRMVGRLLEKEWMRVAGSAPLATPGQ